MAHTPAVQSARDQQTCVQKGSKGLITHPIYNKLLQILQQFFVPIYSILHLDVKSIRYLCMTGNF